MLPALFLLPYLKIQLMTVKLLRLQIRWMRVGCVYGFCFIRQIVSLHEGHNAKKKWEESN